ncbi:MAG: hypothetical protein M3Q23_05065 [Actinomycetota bacterium]|nr:hypothetical protein [Actinomycetota bacterium]
MVLVLAVFAWAVLRLAGAFQSSPSAEMTAGTLQTTGWTLQYPTSWHAQDLPACPNAPDRTGIVVTDTSFVFRNPSGQLPSCGDRLVLAGFPKTGVAVALMPVGIRIGLFISTPDTPFPIGWDQLEPTQGIRGGPAESYLGITVDRNDVLWLGTWVGQDAPESALAQARSVVASLQVQGAAHWTTYHDRVHGLSVTYPDDWYRAGSTLTPRLAIPTEILSLGSYPLRPGGKACTDVYLPGNAISDLGLGDVFITLQQTDPGLPPRPARFGPGAARDTWNSFPACDGYQAKGLRAWWIPFQDAGRGFFAFVALGPGVGHDPQVLRVVWHVLDSLRFQPS